MPSIRLPNGKVVRNVPEGITKEQFQNNAIKAGWATPEDFGLSPVETGGNVEPLTTQATPAALTNGATIPPLSSPGEQQPFLPPSEPVASMSQPRPIQGVDEAPDAFQARVNEWQQPTQPMGQQQPVAPQQPQLPTQQPKPTMQQRVQQFIADAQEVKTGMAESVNQPGFFTESVPDFWSKFSEGLSGKRLAAGFTADLLNTVGNKLRSNVEQNKKRYADQLRAGMITQQEYDRVIELLDQESAQNESMMKSFDLAPEDTAKVREFINKEEEEATPKGLSLVQRGMRSGAVSSMMNAPSTFAAVLGQTPLATAMFALPTYTSSYADAIEEGLDPDTANEYASLQTMVEVGTEANPIQKLKKIGGVFKGKKKEIETLKDKAFDDTLGKDVKDFMLSELGGEQVAFFGQTAIDIKYGMGIGKKWAGMTPQQRFTYLAEGAGESLVATLFAGGGQATLAAGVRRVFGDVDTGKAEKAIAKAIEDMPLQDTPARDYTQPKVIEQEAVQATQDADIAEAMGQGEKVAPEAHQPQMGSDTQSQFAQKMQTLDTKAYDDEKSGDEMAAEVATPQDTPLPTQEKPVEEAESKQESQLEDLEGKLNEVAAEAQKASDMPNLPKGVDRLTLSRALDEYREYVTGGTEQTPESAASVLKSLSDALGKPVEQSSVKPETKGQLPLFNREPAAYKDAWIAYDKLKNTYLDNLDETATSEEVMENLDVFTKPQQRVLKALDKADWLGFDYPSQAISAAMSEQEDYADMEWGQGVKSAIGNLVNETFGRSDPDVKFAKKSGYKGTDPVEAKEWIEAKKKNLPMDEKSRMARAKEMGFDTSKIWYHGTGSEFKAFKSGYGGVYFSDSPKYAERYTDRQGNAGRNIIPAFLKLSNTFDTRKPEHKKIYNEMFLNKYGNGTPLREDGLPDWVESHDFQEFFEAEGLPFDSAIVGEPPTIMQDGSAKQETSLLVTKESNIRSINAAFDPDAADSADLLANREQAERIPESKPEKPVERKDAQQAIDDFLKEYKGVKNIPVKVFDNATEAYGQKIVDKEQLKPGDVSGSFWRGGIQIIRDGNATKDDVTRTLRHEAWVHYGLSLMNPEQKAAFLKRIKGLIAESRELTKIAEGVRKDYTRRDGSFSLKDDVFYEEVAAKIAEKYGDEINDIVTGKIKKPTAFQTQLKKFYDVIVSALRQLGLLDKSVPREAQVQEAIDLVLDRAAALRGVDSKNLRQGKTKGSPLFMVKNGEAKAEEAAPAFARKLPSKKQIAEVQTETKKQINNLRGEVGRIFRRNLTKEGGLSERAFAAKIKSQTMRNADEWDAEFMSAQFTRAAEKAFGKKYSKIDDETKQKMAFYLSGGNAALPKEVKDQLDMMRTRLDLKSEELVSTLLDMIQYRVEEVGQEKAEADAQVISTWNLIDKIRSSKGTYVNRSYQAFDDPDWAKSVKKDKAIMDDARAFFRNQLSDKYSGKELDDRVEGEINAILDKAESASNPFDFLSVSRTGVKDTSSLKKRKDVPEPIRKLLGEYKDPHVSFVRSLTKMSNLVAGHNMLKEIREDGLETGILSKKPKDKTYKLIEGGEKMSPLSGLYANRELADALNDMLQVQPMSQIMSVFVSANAMVKYGKTILSPKTQARNFLSNIAFAIVNGHWSPVHSVTAAKTILGKTMKKQEYHAYVRKLLDLGVIHDSPRAEELREALNDIIKNDGGWRKALRKPGELMTTLYGFSDDFWKITGFEQEIWKAKKFRGMSQEEAERFAADRIRNGYPTYSQVPKQIQNLRKWILVGNFVSFPWEVVRTTKNQFGYLKEDFTDSKASVKLLAAQRLAGMLFAAGAFEAMRQLSMSMFGLDDEDDEAVRELGAPWSRNSTLIYTGREPHGEITYMDSSAYDPFNYLKRPITALMTDRPADVTALEIGKELLEPFWGVEMAPTAIAEAFTNTTPWGSKITEKEGFDGIKERADFVRKNLQPGILTQLENLYKSQSELINPAVEGVPGLRYLAVQGAKSSGKQYELKDELLGFFPGATFTTRNIGKDIAYRGFGAKDRINGASKDLRKIITNNSYVTSDQIEWAVDEFIETREKAYQDMIDYTNLGEKIGLTELALVESLKYSGFSKSDAMYILEGSIPPVKVAGFFNNAIQTALLYVPEGAERDAFQDKLFERSEVAMNMIFERSNSEGLK